jgi:hypothetical protein
LKDTTISGSIPNQKTINAMQKARGGQLKLFDTMQLLIDDLNNERLVFIFSIAVDLEIKPVLFQ